MNMNATILGQAIAFVIFVWFCMKYVWPPLMAAIEKRQKEDVYKRQDQHPRQVPCYITHTNEKTHDVIRNNLDRSPMYAGVIEGCLLYTSRCV